MRSRETVSLVDEYVGDRPIGLEVGDELVEPWAAEFRAGDTIVDVEVSDMRESCPLRLCDQCGVHGERHVQFTCPLDRDVYLICKRVLLLGFTLATPAVHHAPASWPFADHSPASPSASIPTRH